MQVSSQTECHHVSDQCVDDKEEEEMILLEYEAELEEREKGGEGGETPFNTSNKSLGEDLMESINNGTFDAYSTKVSRKVTFCFTFTCAFYRQFRN